MVLVKQELPTLPEHMSSFPVLNKVRVARSLVFCVVFGRPLFVLLVWTLIVCPFCADIRCFSFLRGHSLSVLSRCAASFGHCMVGTSSNYGFLLPIVK